MDDNSANALRLTHHFAGPPALVWAMTTPLPTGALATTMALGIVFLGIKWIWEYSPLTW